MRRAAALISVVLWLHPAVTFAAPDPAELEARRLFAEGERQFKLGAFDVALASFTAAYEKRPLPGFLFNLGQCHRMLEHHERRSSSSRATSGTSRTRRTGRSSKG